MNKHHNLGNDQIRDYLLDLVQSKDQVMEQVCHTDLISVRTYPAMEVVTVNDQMTVRQALAGWLVADKEHRALFYERARAYNPFWEDDDGLTSTPVGPAASGSDTGKHQGDV